MYTDIYIYINGKISIDIICVGLAPARPNYMVIHKLQSTSIKVLYHTLLSPSGMVTEPSMGPGILCFKVQLKLHSTIFALLC